MTSKDDLKALFMEHYDRMYLLARVMLHDDEESRDVVSDVFAQIAERMQTVDQVPETDGIDLRPKTAKSYLLTCVRNRCLKVIRAKQVRLRARKLLQLDDGIEMIPIEAQTDHLTEVLRYSEQTFTPQTLHVFRLRYQQRKKYTEIASELQISEVAVYKHLAQALKKIKQHFCQVTTL